MSTIDQEMVLAHFIVSDDVERSRRFYTDVLGGRTVISGEGNDEVTYVALANSWIIINVEEVRPTTSRPSRSRRRPTQIGCWPWQTDFTTVLDAIRDLPAPT